MSQRTVIAVTPTADTAAIKRLARRHGVQVASITDDIELAARAVQNGDADGILAVHDAWATLVVPANGTLATAREDLPVALSTVGAAALTGAAATAGPVGLVALPAVLGTLVKRSIAERRRRGQRVGRRPNKPSRSTTERIVDLKRQGHSLGYIAGVLTDDEVPTPSGGERWYPATVKRLLDASRQETRLVLRRLATILNEIDAEGSVTEEALAQIARKHNFHPHRLWLAFQKPHEFGHPYNSGFVPPVQRRGTRYAVSKGGHALLDLWRRSEELDDRVEAIALEIAAKGGADGVDPQLYGSICRAHDLDAADVPSELVEFAPGTGRFALTAAGRDAAETWRRLTSDDPRERLDIDFWPEEDEEDRLGPLWDWDDDPLVDPA